MSVNLLPWREQQHRKHIYHLILYHAISACFIFLIFVSLEWFFTQKTEIINDAIFLDREKISALPLNHLKQNEVFLKKLKTIGDEKQSTVTANTAMANKLLEIANDLPASMIFQSLNCHNNKMMLQGVGENINDIHDYVTLLQKKLTGAIMLSDIHKKPKNIAEFYFTIRATP